MPDRDRMGCSTRRLGDCNQRHADLRRLIVIAATRHQAGKIKGQIFHLNLNPLNDLDKLKLFVRTHIQFSTTAHTNNKPLTGNRLCHMFKLKEPR